MTKLFISFRTEDRAVAQYLEIKLRSLSCSEIEPFISLEIPGGREWKSEIETALRDAAVFVLLYTLPEANWNWCLYEAAYFRGIWSSRQGGGHLVCLESPVASKPLPPLADLQAYKADETGIEQFLVDLLVKGRFTGGKAISADVQLGKAKELSEVCKILSDQMSEMKATDYFENRVVISPTNIGEKNPALFIEQCTVQGAAFTMAMLGFNKDIVRWPEFRGAAALRKGAVWVQELESRLRNMIDASAREQSPATGTMTPFHAGLRYCLPVLARVDRIRNVFSQVVVIFIEVGGIQQDDSTYELRRVPPVQAAIVRLLNLARSFRWDVINPFIDFVERHEEKMRAGDAVALEQLEAAYREYRSGLDRLGEESRKHNFEVESYVEALLELQTDDVITNLWSKSYEISGKIEKAVESKAAADISKSLREFQRLNKLFIIICLEKYLAEVVKLRPKELTLEVAHNEIQGAGRKD